MVAQSISRLLKEKVAFELECIDRLYINGYVPGLQTGGQFVGFVRHLGKTVFSTSSIEPLTQAFVRSIERFIGKPWNDYELMSAIGQALAHRELLLENRELANLVRLEMGDKTPEQMEAERLEAIEPGITEVNWGPDGSVLLDPEFRAKE